MLSDFPADYSIDCDADVSARAVSSNSKPEPDVLLLAAAAGVGIGFVGVGAGGAEEAEGDAVWLVEGCATPPGVGAVACDAVGIGGTGVAAGCDIGADCVAYDADGVDIAVGPDVDCCDGMEGACD